MGFPDGSCQKPVQGDLVLRDGEYVSEHDTFMTLEGVYIIATGRLQAVVTPKNSIQVSLEQRDLDLHTADYRSEPTPQQIVLWHCCTVMLLPFWKYYVQGSTSIAGSQGDAENKGCFLRACVVTCSEKLSSVTHWLISHHIVF